MDSESLQKKIEEIFARQVRVAPHVKDLVRQKLEAMDWDEFKSRVMEKYLADVDAEEGTLSPADCNALLMDAIRAELEGTFGSEAPPTADEEGQLEKI
ncbi:MAG TPA: hypothetical protein VMY18_08240 [Acidobacteriota bacterium]|nr:hypothetical protein [Acidobacteriota bacterium]